MKQKIFPDLEGQVLIEALEAQSNFTEITAIERTLSPEQIKEFALRGQKLQERKVEIEDHLAEYVKPLKEEIKDINAETKASARVTKKGYIESEEKVFWIPDFENRTMLAYDTNGELVKTRAMKREERQLTIVTDLNQATGTNGN